MKPQRPARFVSTATNTCIATRYPNTDDLKPFMRKSVLVAHPFGMIAGKLMRWDRNTYKVVMRNDTLGVYEHALVKFTINHVCEIITYASGDPPIVYINAVYAKEF